MAEILVTLTDDGEAYVGLAGPEPPEVRQSVELDALKEADGLPALDSMVLDFDFYGRLVGIRITSSASSALPPALPDPAQPGCGAPASRERGLERAHDRAARVEDL